MAITFGLTLLPMLMLVGAAVDYSQASNLLSKLQSKVDSAALAACKSNATAPATLQAAAQAVLSNYLPAYPVTITSFAATNTPRSINLTAQVNYPTKILKIASINTIPVSATSTCGAGEANYEIAMIMDTTGSMNNSAGATTKIAAMRNSATSFVNTMFTSFTAAHVKIALVPFAASVRVNPTTWAPTGTPTASWFDLNATSSAHWQNVLSPAASGFTSRFSLFTKLKAVSSGWGWAGCLEALPYPYNTQDTAPSSATPNSRYVPLFAPDEVGTENFLFGVIDLGHDTTSPLTSNSYLDDGTASSGACDNNNASKPTRMGQACKYATPTRARTSEYGPNWGCTSQALTQLTNNQSTLTSAISSLVADGSTNIAEGLHWGWRTVTNTGVFTEAAAYGAPTVTKVMLLMTDGVNTWNANPTAYVTRSDYSAYGYFTNADGSTTSSRLPPTYSNLSTSTDSRNALDQLTRETCTNAKAKGVVIYAIAFSTPGDAIDASGQSLLRTCASGSDHFYLAADSASLDASFAAIAQGIGQLRISQ